MLQLHETVRMVRGDLSIGELEGSSHSSCIIIDRNPVYADQQNYAWVAPGYAHASTLHGAPTMPRVPMR